MKNLLNKLKSWIFRQPKKQDKIKALNAQVKEWGNENSARTIINLWKDENGKTGGDVQGNGTDVVNILMEVMQNNASFEYIMSIVFLGYRAKKEKEIQDKDNDNENIR